MNLQETIKRILRETRVPRSERVELYKDENIIVVVPLTHRALQKYAHQCQWCINDDSGEWEDYHKGKHAVIIQRNPKKPKIGITGQPVPSEIFVLAKWDNNQSSFEDVCGMLEYEFRNDRTMSDYYINITNDINNFATNIVYYSPETGIYDQEDNFLWNFNYEINKIPNVTPQVIKIMDDYLQESEEMNLQESIRRIIREEFLNESDPKTGTGKKPKGSDRRLYTDENPSDTVSVKFKTKEDIVDTLNKESFKSKSHKRQSQIINLIHQRVRAAYQNASDPETKKRLKRGLDYIENEKEKSKEKTVKLQKEGLHDTSWENDEGDKITLMDLLNATKDIPIKKVSVNKLKKHLLTWDGDEDEVKKIESADLQYPILIFVDNDGEFISIIDGHHRAQKAVRRGLETIKAKVIPINSLPKDIRKVFSHMGRQEEMKEGELTEKCWAGYTQKGMKTMFGKRYPNCVKKTK